MKSLLFSLALSLSAPIAMAQTEVGVYQPGVTAEGVSYFLPQTALRVTLEAERVTTTPGRLNKYAFRYLRMRDVPSEQQTQWVIKGITVQPYGVPDKAKAYSVKLKSRTIAPLVSLTREGVLLSINTQQEEELLPAKPKSQVGETPVDATRYLSQEVLSAGSTAKMAELIAQEIYDLRENRKELIAGEAENSPKDGAQLQLMLSQIDQQAEALESLFAGTKQSTTEYFTFDYLPTSTDVRDVLFRFSSLEGPVAAENLLGSPVYIQLSNLEQLPQAAPEEGRKKGKVEEGVRYNVPARNNVRVFTADATYADFDVAFGQFGHVEILSNVLFDKKATTRVTFHQLNGAVKRIDN